MTHKQQKTQFKLYSLKIHQIVDRPKHDLDKSHKITTDRGEIKCRLQTNKAFYTKRKGIISTATVENIVGINWKYDPCKGMSASFSNVTWLRL